MRNPPKIYLFYLLSILICVFVLFTIQQKSKAAKPVSTSEHEYSIIEKLNQKQPVTIVAYGDSITWGYDRDTKGKVYQVKNPYPKVLEKELKKEFGYHKINVINRGHPGWTSIQALENLDEEVLSYNPDFVLLMFGINDARGHKTYSPNALPVPVDRYIENNQHILQKLNENGIEVAIITPTSITNNKNNGNKKLTHFTNAIRLLSQAETVHYVNGGEIPTKGNLSDGIHFRAEKYQLIAEKIMLDLFGQN